MATKYKLPSYLQDKRVNDILDVSSRIGKQTNPISTFKSLDNEGKEKTYNIYSTQRFTLPPSLNKLPTITKKYDNVNLSSLSTLPKPSKPFESMTSKELLDYTKQNRSAFSLIDSRKRELNKLIGTKQNEEYVPEPTKKIEINNPILKFLDRIGGTAADTATYGTQDYLKDKRDTGNKVANTVADIVGTGLGMTVNPIGMSASASKLLSPIGSYVEKIVPKVSQPIANKLIPSAVRGASEFGSYGAMEGYAKGEDLPTTLKNVGTNALGGAVFGTGVKGLGIGLNKILPKKVVAEPTIEPPKTSILNPNGKLKPVSQSVTMKPGETVNLNELARNQEKQPFKINLQNFPLKTPEVKPSGALENRRFVNTVRNSETTAKSVSENLKDMKYDVKSNQDVYALAKDYVNKNYDDAVALIKSNAEPTAESNAIAQELMRRLQNEGKYSEAIDIVERVAEKSTKQGQAIQALSMWARLSPEGMLKYAQRQVNKANAELKAKFPNASKIKLTDEEAKNITEMMKKVEKLEDGREKDILLGQVSNIINDKIPSSISDKIRAWQRISMLLNPKTMVRNTLGNVVMGTMEGIKDIPGTLVDKAISLKTGKRTTTLPNVGFGDYVKGVKTGVKNVIEDAKLGINTSPTSGQFDLPTSTKTFKNPILNKLDRATSIGLQFGDRPFYQGVYNQNVKQLMKLNKLDKPTQEIMDQASKLAEERTFQNISELVKGFNEARNAINRIGSKIGIGGEEFGLGNIVLPFTKTPANILDKAIDYSPLGLVKIAKILRAPKFDQKALVDTIGRTVTGTSAILLGYDLAKNGHITGRLDKDKDVADMQRQAGISPYSWKVGDTYRTYDWMQPSAIPLAIGADIYYQGKNRKEASSVVWEAVKSGGQTLFNQSVIQGLQRFMGGYSPIDNLANTLQNIPSGFIPTVSKQSIQLNDSTTRSTYDPSIIKETGNMIKAKLPVLNKSLEPKVDTLGKDVQLYQGSNNIINVLLNSGFTTKEKITPVQSTLLDIYNKTGEKDFFPKVAPKTMTKTIEGKTYSYTLTPEDITEFQRKLGQETEKEYSSIINSSQFINSDYDTKRNILKKVLDNIYSSNQTDLLKRKGVIK